MASNNQNFYQAQDGDHPPGESLEQLHARGVRLNIEFMDDYLAGRPLPPGLQAYGLPARAHDSRTGVPFDGLPQAPSFGEMRVPPTASYSQAGFAQCDGYELHPPQAYASQAMPYGLQQPPMFLSGHQIHRIEEQQAPGGMLGQANADAQGRPPVMAAHIDQYGTHNPNMSLDTPSNSMPTAEPQPKYKRLKIVHTCEPADAEFVMRYKIGSWNDSKDRRDAPRTKVKIPSRGTSTKEVWRCAIRDCKFCRRTAEGWTDLTASLAFSHGITGVPVKGGNGQMARPAMRYGGQDGNPLVPHSDANVSGVSIPSNLLASGPASVFVQPATMSAEAPMQGAPAPAGNTSSTGGDQTDVSKTALFAITRSPHVGIAEASSTLSRPGYEMSEEQRMVGIRVLQEVQRCIDAEYQQREFLRHSDETTRSNVHAYHSTNIPEGHGTSGQPFITPEDQEMRDDNVVENPVITEQDPITNVTTTMSSQSASLVDLPSHLERGGAAESDHEAICGDAVEGVIDLVEQAKAAILLPFPTLAAKLGEMPPFNRGSDTTQLDP